MFAWFFILKSVDNFDTILKKVKEKKVVCTIRAYIKNDDSFVQYSFCVSYCLVIISNHSSRDAMYI